MAAVVTSARPVIKRRKPPRYPYDLRIADHPVDYGVKMKVRDLDIERLAQRTVNMNRVRDMADNMIPSAIGTVLVSQRSPGQNYLMDGQHRWEALKLKGIERVWCEVHHGLTVQEEAVMFLVKNREGVKPNPLDTYRIGLTGGVAMYVDTEDVVTAHGLTVGNSSAGSIGAIQGLLTITTRYGPDILKRTLTVAETAWGRTSTTWDGVLLGGLGMFLGKHGAVIDDKALAKKLAKRAHAEGWRGIVMNQASNYGTHSSGSGGRVSAAYSAFKFEWNKNRSQANRIQ